MQWVNQRGGIAIRFKTRLRSWQTATLAIIHALGDDDTTADRGQGRTRRRI